MTGNGNQTTYKNGDDWGMVYYCFTHINLYINISDHNYNIMILTTSIINLVWYNYDNHQTDDNNY